ncbi:hypothetical protein BH11CYA1_BH11CYA1_34170 [soil metagenome]
MVRYFVAITSALLTLALSQLAVLAVIELGHVMAHSVGRLTLGLDIFQLFIAFLDWAACIACVLVGLNLAPGRKLSTAVGLSAFVAVWHLWQILVVISFAEAIGAGIVPLSIIYYGGLLVTGALCCYVYERVSGVSEIGRRRALAAIAGPSVYKQALTTVEAEVIPLESGFFDFDLVLLEDELFKIKPDRDAYISALRLGMAIERDCGYVNCRARSASFAELMSDVSMRLSATYQDELVWVSLASGFRQYKAEASETRRARIAALHDLLDDQKYRPTGSGEQVADDLSQKREPALSAAHY